MLRRPLSFMAVVAATILPVSVLAYNLSGRSFQPLTWPGIVNVEMNVTGRNSGENLAIRNAMASWSRTNTGARFQYIDNVSGGNPFQFFNYGDIPELAFMFASPASGYYTSFTVDVNASKPWATNGDPLKYDFESMAAHELGHALGMAHSTTTVNTMYKTLSKGQTNWRSLEADDKNGAKNIYGIF